MKKIVLSFLLCSLLLNSCMKPEKRRSFVMYYCGVDEIQLSNYNGTGTNYTGMGINIYTVGGNVVAGYKDEAKKQVVYDSLCIKHNDMTYHNAFGAGDYVLYPSVDFKSIDIVSDADFDTKHPAGSSIAGIVRLKSYSIKKFIDSGYKLSDSNRFMIPYNPVEKLASELMPEDLILLGNGDFANRTYLLGNLFFESLPSLSKTHNFTVTMAADDGRVFSASVEITFE